MKPLDDETCALCQRPIADSDEGEVCPSCERPVHAACREAKAAVPVPGACLLCGAPPKVVEMMGHEVEQEMSEYRREEAKDNGLRLIGLGITVVFVGVGLWALLSFLAAEEGSSMPFLGGGIILVGLLTVFFGLWKSVQRK
jgi:hypothetical protein